MAGKRDPYIDFTRAVGMYLLVMAHVDTSDLLASFRSFSLPLLILASGLVHSGKVSKWDPVFFLKRMKRLLVPVWLFVLVVFIPFMYWAVPAGIAPYVEANIEWSINTMLFLSRHTYGFTWIFRVLLLIMLATPLFTRINSKIETWKGFILFLAGMVVGDYVLLKGMSMLPGDATGLLGAFCFVMNEYVLYFLGYSVFFFLGMRLRHCEEYRKGVNVAALLLLVVTFVGVILKDGSIDFIRYKYPPSMFYLLYGVAMCCLFWANVKIFRGVCEWKIFQFVGKNSMWLFLWHIPFVFLVNSIVEFWPLRYLLICCCAALVYGVQYTLVKRSNSAFAKKYLLG